jgi:hypothetical protein
VAGAAQERKAGRYLQLDIACLTHDRSPPGGGGLKPCGYQCPAHGIGQNHSVQDGRPAFQLPDGPSVHLHRAPGGDPHGKERA